MSRLSTAAFAVLVLATIAAFFVSQHLKVTTPLIAGSPKPDPAVINPVSGGTCGGKDRRYAQVSFYLLHRADDVDVYVVDQAGTIVNAVGHRHMGIKQRVPFTWNGREQDGRIAPDGTYYFRVALIHQGRTLDISGSSGPEPITVVTARPRPAIVQVTPTVIRQGSRAAVTIRYSGNQGVGAIGGGGRVLLYRASSPGRLRLVKSFGISGAGPAAVWNGEINQRPAPAGTYQVALSVTNATCNTGTFPARLPPAPGSTPPITVTS